MEFVGKEASCFFAGDWQPCHIAGYDANQKTFSVSVSGRATLVTIPQPHVYCLDKAGPSWQTQYGSTQMGKDLPQMIDHLQLRLADVYTNYPFPTRAEHEKHYCHCMLGNAFGRMGDYQHQLEAYEADLQGTLARNDYNWLPAAYDHLAESLLSLGRCEEALSAADKALQAAIGVTIRKRGCLEYAYGALTRCYHALGWPEEALKMAIAHDTSYGNHVELAPPNITQQCSECWFLYIDDIRVCSRCGSRAMVPLGSMTQPGWDGGWTGGRARNYIYFAELLHGQSAITQLEKALAAARSSDAYDPEVTCLHKLAKACLEMNEHAESLQWLNQAFQMSRNCNAWLHDEEVRATVAVIARDSWKTERVLWFGQMSGHPMLSKLDSNLVRHISVFAGFRGEWAGRNSVLGLSF